MLELVTGGAINPYRLLMPGHELYPLFALAWAEQGSWNRDQHDEFWCEGLRTWPPKTGPVRLYEAISRSIAARRRWGLTEDQIIARLERKRETLRRQRAFRLADEHQAQSGGATVQELAAGADFSDRARVRAPVIVALGIEDRPNLDCVYFPECLKQFWPESVHRAEADLAARAGTG